jgi:hypothetical protein
VTLDPNDPGAMASASVGLTRSQVRQLAELVEGYVAEKRLDSVRLEKLKDAYLRVVFIGPDGDPAGEETLPPL